MKDSILTSPTGIASVDSPYFQYIELRFEQMLGMWSKMSYIEIGDVARYWSSYIIARKFYTN